MNHTFERLLGNNPPGHENKDKVAKAFTSTPVATFGKLPLPSHIK